LTLTGLRGWLIAIARVNANLTVASGGASPFSIIDFKAPPAINGTVGLPSGRIVSGFDNTVYAGTRVTIQNATGPSTYVDVLSVYGTSVGIGILNPISSALLDLTSTTKGFLPPRMTTTQKNAIASPATGLQVYDSTTLTPSIYNGTNWQNALVPNTTGNVLINTTTDTGHKLLVSGSGASGSVNLNNTLYVSGSNVGIGTGTPGFGLHVIGTAGISSTLTLSATIIRGGSGLTTFLQNTNGERMFTYGQNGALGDYIAIGRVSGNTSATSRNTILGSAAGNGLTSGVANTLIGYGAMNGANTNSNTCIGDLAGQNLSGGGNTIIGANNFSGGSLGGSSIGIGVNNTSNTLFTLPTNTIVLGNSNYLATSSFVTNATYIGNSLATTSTTLSNVVILGRSDQNVLIGEPSSNAGFKLDVNGTARVTNLTVNNSIFGQGSTQSLVFNNGTGITTLSDNIGIQLNLNNSTFFSFRSSASGGTNRFLMIANAVGSLPAQPNASAVLQLYSTNAGFLPPQMTGAQAELISSPAEGLMIYATAGTGVTITSKGWWGYDGATWVKLN